MLVDRQSTKTSIKQLLALTMLPSSDWIPSHEPPFRKEIYVVVLVPCFLSSTFLYVHSCNMFSCLVLNYGSTPTTLPYLTQYSIGSSKQYPDRCRHVCYGILAVFNSFSG